MILPAPHGVPGNAAKAMPRWRGVQGSARGRNMKGMIIEARAGGRRGSIPRHGSLPPGHAAKLRGLRRSRTCVIERTSLAAWNRHAFQTQTKKKDMANEIQTVQPSGNPFALQSQGGGALQAVMGNAEVANTLASIYIAKQFPRNMAEVTRNMEAACSRKSLAERALYAYPRGGQTVEGPSIRLAECLLAAWGNAESGWREVSRRRAPGKDYDVSECVAFAFDKENNTRREIAFSVNHWRDTKTGGYALNDERDIYELCANKAARRMRACILSIIPAWLIEEALEKVNVTLNGDGKEPLADTIRKMEAKFAELGVTRAMLEAKQGHQLEQCVRPEVVQLGKVYTSIRDGYTRVQDVFPPEPQEAASPEIGKATATAAATPAPAPPAAQGAGMFGEEV